MKEINIDEKLAGQKMMRCLERYLSNAPKSLQNAEKKEYYTQ